MKINNIVILLLALIVVACNNSEWDYPDYETQGCCFPYQTPARTLILGKYEQGYNDNDNNHLFEIGAIMTGVYENSQNRKVHFEVDNELLTGVSNVEALPTEYYTIETTSPVTISSGSTKGRIQIKLNDAFFEDELAFGAVNTTHYVVPLRITEVENLDSILSGVPLFEGAIRTHHEDWATLAKDYTLFGIKFMNEYHGAYLMRGKDTHTNIDGDIIEDEYRNQYVERDIIIDVHTSGRDKVIIEKAIRKGGDESPGDILMELSFDDDKNCTISSTTDDLNAVNGTGKFITDGDMWGGKKRDVLHLQYTYTDALSNQLHSVNDTLVLRDRKAVFEEFEIELGSDD